VKYHLISASLIKMASYNNYRPFQNAEQQQQPLYFDYRAIRHQLSLQYDSDLNRKCESQKSNVPKDCGEGDRSSYPIPFTPPPSHGQSSQSIPSHKMSQVQDVIILAQQEQEEIDMIHQHKRIKLDMKVKEKMLKIARHK